MQQHQHTQTNNKQASIRIAQTNKQTNTCVTTANKQARLAQHKQTTYHGLGGRLERLADAPLERRAEEEAAGLGVLRVGLDVAARHNLGLALGRVAAAVLDRGRVDRRQRRHERRVAQVERRARRSRRALDARVRARDAAAAVRVVVGPVGCQYLDRVRRVLREHGLGARRRGNKRRL